jgi:hypothetical protein
LKLPCKRVFIVSNGYNKPVVIAPEQTPTVISTTCWLTISSLFQNHPIEILLQNFIQIKFQISKTFDLFFIRRINMKLRCITEADFEFIIKEESEIYPIESNLNKEILLNWYLKEDSISDFGMIYEGENQSIDAFALILPFNKKSFSSVCKGEKIELESNYTDFTTKNSKEKETGFHFYHIHRFNEKVKRLFETVMKDLAIIQKKYELNVVGCSCLAVSNSGISLFYNTLNFHEKEENLNNEHLMEKDSTMIVVKTNDMKEIQNKMKQGYKYLRRCKFLVTYSNDISQVWTFLNQ